MPKIELPNQHHLIHLSGTDLDYISLSEIAKLDNKVFSGPPWFDGTYCDDCQGMKKDQASSYTEECLSCGAVVVALHTRMRKINDELQKDLSYVAMIKSDQELLIGYAFGYYFPNPLDFVMAKYKTIATQTAVLTQLQEAGIRESFYYYSGMGIDAEYRGQGLSNYLGKALDEYALSLGLPGVTRTLATSPIVKMRQKLGFKIILGPGIEPQADFENPKRVLMVRK
jgi:GNAT superfamily N-acetyltransferase